MLELHFGQLGVCLINVETATVLLQVQGAQCLERYSRLPPDFSLHDYFEALFGIQPGRYRMFIIVVSPEPISAGTQSIDHLAAATLWTKGSTHLPTELTNQRIPKGAKAVVLIYEFIRERQSDEAAHVQLSSALTPLQHVIRAGLFDQGRSSTEERAHE